MNFKKLISFCSLILFALSMAHAQHRFIEKVEMHIDTSIYASDRNSIEYQGQKQLYFYYDDEKETADIKVFAPRIEGKLQLVESRDFVLIDSLINFQSYYRFKVQFQNITRSNFLRFTFNIKQDTSETFEEILLFPLTNTTADIYPKDHELFIGEEKSFELESNNLSNIQVDAKRMSSGNVDYRFTEIGGRILLHLTPNALGSQLVTIPISVRKPHLTEAGMVSYQLDTLKHIFHVKASRLRYLQVDEQEYTLNEESRTAGIEIQLENYSRLQMNKTYRIENQEEAGGTLIAELFTKQRLTNNRVLCILRPYNYHRTSKGYLYIKEGDAPRFITNFSITPETRIHKISILQEGRSWKTTNQIHPGETIDLKIEGTGLHKADFQFEDLIDITKDSLIRNENEVSFKLQVPSDISKKQINVYNHYKSTGSFLDVVEYQRPREFDFIFINYGDMGRRLNGLKSPVLFEDIIKDITFSFNANKIDSDEFYGKQFIDIDIKITGKNNELIELKSIDNIVICPSSSSPRSEYYSASDCFTGDLNLNKYISKKTYDLQDWSKINIIIKHDKSKYGGEGFNKELDIILKRRTSFDVEVSFPAGLITISEQDDGKMGFGSLSGISMAMIAQFSFYHPEKINKYRPYKVGAGFLAFNAFNFSDDVDNRDVGIVVLGSLYPTTRDVKLTFPLYIGGGYFLKEEKFFFLIGPGIRVKL